MLLLPPRRGFLVKESNFMGIKQYIEETKVELKHVSWPTRKQAIAFTVAVIVLSVAISFYLGFFDFIFSTLLKQVI